MKLRTFLLENNTKYISEGTHYGPQTLAQAKKLASLFSKPLKAKEAEQKLQGILSDDDFSDSLMYTFRLPEAADTDVRWFVADWLNKNWIKDIPVGKTNNSRNSWNKDWDIEALKLLRVLCKKYGYSSGHIHK